MELYMERYHAWLESPYVDADTKAELKALADNTEEIRFH